MRYLTGRNDMPNPQKPHKRLMTVKEAAEALSLTPWSVYKLLDSPDATLASVYQGRRRYVVVESLDEYVAGLPTTSPDAA
jgi:hypothetical protein